jgi:uncharacterized protein YjbI with pentapeptide repeats
MSDSPADREAIVEVLSAFVRRRAKRRPDGRIPWPESEADADEVKPPARVQAALNVLGRRDPDASLRGPDLRDTDLRGARMRPAHFPHSTLRRAVLYKAHLQESDFSNAVFVDAVLSEARLRGANLTGADLTGADLTGANLTGADLRDATITQGALSDEQLRTATNVDFIRWTTDNITSGTVGRRPP